MAMYLVDGVRLFRRAYDLDRDKQMQLPTGRFISAQVFRFNPAYTHLAHAIVPANASSLSSSRIWTSGVERTSRFLFQLTAREDYA